MRPKQIPLTGGCSERSLDAFRFFFQNKTNVTSEKDDMMTSANISKPNARRKQARATCGYMVSGPARARLLWAILSLVLPVTFGHTTACRSPALAFSAAIHFAMKRSAPRSAVLRYSPSPWADLETFHRPPEKK